MRHPTRSSIAADAKTAAGTCGKSLKNILIAGFIRNRIHFLCMVLPEGNNMSVNPESAKQKDCTVLARLLSMGVSGPHGNVAIYMCA